MVGEDIFDAGKERGKANEEKSADEFGVVVDVRMFPTTPWFC